MNQLRYQDGQYLSQEENLMSNQASWMHATDHGVNLDDAALKQKPMCLRVLAKT